MAEPPEKFDKKSRYTEGRGIAGAFEGETVTRRRMMEGTALAVGGIATMAFALPGLGFALGPLFEKTVPDSWQDVGSVADFNDTSYVPRVININPVIGDAGKTTIYVRRFDRGQGQGRRGAGFAAVRGDLHALRPPRLSRPVHPGVAEIRLPMPRRRVRLPGPG